MKLPLDAPSEFTSPENRLAGLATTAYLTLLRNSEIISLNLYGSQMLGNERSLIINTPFVFFVTDETKTVFTHFLDKVFSTKTKRSCHVQLKTKGKPSIHIHLTGIYTEKNDHCLLSMVDVTERKNFTEFSNTLLTSLPHPAMYIRVKDRVVLAANKIATDLGVKVGGYCWREFMKAENISQHDKQISDQFPEFIPSEYLIHCTFCLGDKCFVHGLHHNTMQVNTLDKKWDIYWIKVSNEIFLHYAVDITEQQNKELTLLEANKIMEESELKFKTITHQTADGIALSDMDGNYLFVNPAFCTMTGYTHDELLTMTVFDLRHPSQVEVFVESKTTLETIPIEVNLQRKDGSILVTEIIGKVITIRDKTYVLGTVRDITERKAAETLFNESESKYRELVENSPDAIAVYIEGKIVFANNQCLRLMAASTQADLLGKPVIQFVHSDSRDLVIKRMKKAADDITVLPLTEEKFIRLDGSSVDVEVKSIPIIFEHKSARLLIVHDISKRIQIAKEKRESEEKYHLIFEHSPMGILSFDVKGVIEACNNIFVQIIGSSTAKLIGLNMLNLPDKKLVSAVTEALNGSSTLYEDTYHSVTADKQTPVRAIFTPIMREDGGIYGGVGIIEDITERKQNEEKIQLAYTKLRAFIDANIVGVVVAEASGTIVEANDYYLNALGYTREDFNKNQVDWIAVTPPEWLPSDEKAIREIRETGVCTPYEKEYIRKDGQRVSVMITDTLLPGPDKQIAAFVLDITDRKKAEKAIKESHERFANLFEFAVDGILIVSANGFITGANSCFCTMVDRKKEDIIGLHINDSFFTPESLVRTPLDFESLQQGKTVVNEREILRPDGTIISVEMHSKMMPDKSYQSIYSDITQRKQAEEALAESNELLSLFMKNSPIYAYIKAVSPHESRVLKASENFKDMIGISGSQMIGKTMHELFPADFATKITEDDWNVSSNGKEIVVEEQINGRYYTTIKYPITTSSKTLLAGYTIDITERKLFEKTIEKHNKELKEINSGKDKFFSIIAHDLRSPFNIFLGFTQMMVEDLPKLQADEIQKIAIAMCNSATNLYSLLENLLEWSLLQRGMSAFEPVSFHLLPKTSEAIQSVMVAAHKKGIEIVFDIPADLQVVADEKMLASTIRNLTSNAVKFTPKGGKITIMARIQPKNFVEISIQDTGIGMPAEMLSMLFQLEANTRRKGTDGEPSTGLGLTLCKEFIDKHGGNIRVESEVGKGSTFAFTLANRR